MDTFPGLLLLIGVECSEDSITGSVRVIGLFFCVSVVAWVRMESRVKPGYSEGVDRDVGQVTSSVVALWVHH